MAGEAKLILEDGTVFCGRAFGARRDAAGEVVFNTGMVGYPESLTDPSYRGQILVFTYPSIGNYGVPPPTRQDGLLSHFESESVHVRGVVVAGLCEQPAHWNSAQSLSAWLEQEGVTGICGIDTRALTRRLRERGVLRGAICHGGGSAIPDPGDDDCGLVAQVSVKEPVVYPGGRLRLALLDCGVKNSIIRAFLRRGFTVLRLPWDHDFTREKADGVILSNGPGDPAACVRTIENVRRALSGKRPLLGICLGSQIMALAAGARTYKLPYGHRGHNQPCRETGTRRCHITSQNHGYAVDADTLPADWRQWFVNANDNSNEGILHVSRPFFGAQFHPEASPGPDDCEFIFDMFTRAVQP
jgi:carbamoyl-phosphate synthase small subunit